MNPSWIPAICASLGLVTNLIWTVLNLKMRADLANQIADLKKWMATEYITREVLELRIKAEHFGRGRAA